ncbi:MAG TPA: glycosyltransferase family 39 protein [bacterium]|nr:glycosyltransferase family 39 protein [bacterium]HPQ67208.1 glycosyltransferase family 39 protein [bacterium]
MKTPAETSAARMLLVFFAVMAVVSSLPKSATYDEPGAIRYGRRLLAGHAGRENAGPMPVMALNALGAAVADSAGAGALFGARLVSVAGGLLAGGLVWAWARRVFGAWPATAATALYVFSPTIMAHARLASHDIWAATGFIAAGYCFRNFIEEGGWKKCLAAAAVLGLAQLTKYTCLLLYPIFLFTLAARAALPGARIWVLRRPGRLLGAAALFLLVPLLIVNLGFGFSGTMAPANDYRSPSPPEGEGGGWRLPLPYPYLNGIVWAAEKERTGEGFGYMYLKGETRKTGGFPDYYVWAVLYKVPIPMLILALLALVSAFSRRETPRMLPEGIHLLSVPLFLFLYFSLAVNVNLGIRYLLPAFPFVIVFVASLFAVPDRGRVSPALYAVLTIWLVVSGYSWYPHLLSYFNEFLPERKGAYLLLADSNLDWGQNLPYLEEYVRRHPGVVVSPPFPVSGRIVVSVNELVGVWGPKKYAWLRNNFLPVETIAYSYLVYDVGAAELKVRGLQP